MKNVLDQYYSDELVSWERTLEFYEEEIPEFEARLVELTRRNTIPNLAVNAEHLLNLFATIHDQIKSIRKKIKRQEKAVQHDDLQQKGQENSLQIATQQNLLRNTMQAAEKTFVDTKYACYNFLSGVTNP